MSSFKFEVIDPGSAQLLGIEEPPDKKHQTREGITQGEPDLSLGAWRKGMALLLEGCP